MYEIGQYIILKQCQKAILSKKEQNGYGDQYFTKEDIQFRVLYKDEDRRKVICIADKPTEQELYLKGKEGYKNGIAELDRICKEISGYENARSMTIEDIENSKYWEDTDKIKSNIIFGEENEFYNWIANEQIGYYNNFKSFSMFCVSGGTVGAYDLYGSDDYDYDDSYAVRPVIEINY